MKLIYNTDAITAPLTGIGRYALNLGLALQKHNQIEDIKLFAGNRWLSELESAVEKNKWLGKLRQHIPFKYHALTQYHKLRSKHFKQLTTELSDHLFHSPNFILTPFHGRSVATFHDLTFVHYRDTQPTYRLKFLDKEIPKTLEQASHLITPSEYVRNEIIDQYGYPGDNISVTPLGVSHHFKPRSDATCNKTLKQFGLKYRSFILSVAACEPRKNLHRLLKAYHALPNTLKKHCPLVLVGSDGWNNKTIKKLIDSLQRKNEIICTGYLSQEQLLHLYSSAQLTAFPSLYEGFGLPIIESMASGTPVLTTQHSAMAEVSHSHALLVNPLDIDHIKQQLEMALNDQTWHNQAKNNGLRHAEHFTWQQCAIKTVQVYKKSFDAYSG